MTFQYCAFGLSLRSSVSFAGLPTGYGSGLPLVDLRIVSEAEMAAGWSGATSSSRWRGALKDGQELSIQWGVEGDLLCRYGERARFHLDSAATALSCGPAVSPSVGWRRVLFSRVLPLVALARGYEALHAAAVETTAGTVAIVGPSGMGKSTLAAELLSRGAGLLADDVLVVGAESKEVLAHPGTAHLSLAATEADATKLGRSVASVAGKRWLSVERWVDAARQLSAVVILDRGGEGALAISEEPSSPLALAPFMLGLPDQPWREGQRFELYSNLIESCRLLRLRAGDGVRPARLADALEISLLSGVGAGSPA